MLDLGVAEQQLLLEQTGRTEETKANASCEYLANARVQSRSGRFYDSLSQSLYLSNIPALSDVMDGSDSFPRSSCASWEGG